MIKIKFEMRITSSFNEPLFVTSLSVIPPLTFSFSYAFQVSTQLNFGPIEVSLFDENNGIIQRPWYIVHAGHEIGTKKPIFTKMVHPWAFYPFLYLCNRLFHFEKKKGEVAGGAGGRFRLLPSTAQLRTRSIYSFFVLFFLQTDDKLKTLDEKFSGNRAVDSKKPKSKKKNTASFVKQKLVDSYLQCRFRILKGFFFL